MLMPEPELSSPPGPLGSLCLLSQGGPPRPVLSPCDILHIFTAYSCPPHPPPQGLEADAEGHPLPSLHLAQEGVNKYF